MRCRTRVAILLLASLGCDREEPPGAESLRPHTHVVGSTITRSGTELTPVSVSPSREDLGSEQDNLPFIPAGLKLASIAWRTWVYSDVGPKRMRYGYLRAGSIVDARGPAIRNEGCPGGWYRINPRGFVCVGMGATLDLEHPVVVASSVRPVRKQGLPYLYAIADDTPPLLYFRLASRDEMERAEGRGLWSRVRAFRAHIALEGLEPLLGPLGPPPEFLVSRSLEKPYGTKSGLHELAHAGASAPASGFSIARVFEWQNRIFGLTSELELVGLDRTKVVRPSEFHGIELAESDTLPIAFAMSRYTPRYRLTASGAFVLEGAFDYREALKLTGRHEPGDMREVEGGAWAPGSLLRIIEPRTSLPTVATGDRKWIDVSIDQQALVAYVGRRPVYVTLVSTGRGGLGDPETTQATVQGRFMIYEKDVSATMDGDNDGAADSYALRDVPFVQYFHNGFALHGTYWHDRFGKVRSHGCVNLSPIDAAWLFEWTDPQVPPDWHGVLNKERGTVVLVRP